MKRTVIWWTAFNVHSLLLYVAFGLGSDGALSVVKFAVWTVAVLACVSLSGEAVRRRLERPPTTWISPEASWVQAWLTLGLLVWFGHTFTAIAWGWFMAAEHWSNTEVAKLRAKTP